jgi:hypothetical protein
MLGGRKKALPLKMDLLIPYILAASSSSSSSSSSISRRHRHSNSIVLHSVIFDTNFSTQHVINMVKKRATLMNDISQQRRRLLEQPFHQQQQQSQQTPQLLCISGVSFFSDFYMNRLTIINY